ncbi:MAG: 6-phosphofructokinase [Candidatus Omnitrophica bacterium]|nr:6-phosphofructokinase [Candidatus Omnitrophota bacterium]
MPKVGVLTGGGDCPGLNAVIRAVTRTAINNNWEVIGIKNGWRGLIDKDYQTFNLESVSGILPKGGTILGTSRTNPYKKEEDVEKVKITYKELNLEALIAIGGEDTLGVANRLFQEGLNIVGVPKTIDNDLNATDYTFGFDTAVNIATECIDRLHTTAESHHRIIVVEVMGRHAGWIAVYSGLAGGADVILIPEIPINIEEVCQLIEKRHSRGKTFSIIVVAEGAKFKNAKEVLKDQEVDEFGHVKLGGVSNILGKLIEERTGYETRVVVLGHIQRGGTPTAFDRILATRYGVKAMKMVLEKKYGKMVALRGNQIIDVPLQEAVAELKTVDLKIYEIAKTFFG